MASQKKKKIPEINGASLADIAFMMLAFILLVSTMDQDSGLMRRLPPIPPPDAIIDDSNKINERNLVQVRITRSDALLAAGRPNLDITLLKDIIIEYITNPSNNPALPEKENKEIPGFGTYSVSKAVISLQNDRETSYDMYLRVQNELIRAVAEVRENFSTINLGKSFLQLTEGEREIVTAAIPTQISEAEPKQTKR